MGMSNSYNGYNYAYGNPTNLTDPSGECGICIPLIIGGLAFINEWRSDVYHNQMNGMSFWDAAYHRNVDFRRATLRGVEWTINVAAGYGTGAGLEYLTKRGVLTVGRAAFAGAVLDVAWGTGWDIGFHGRSFGNAFGDNLLAFGTGEIIGYGTEEIARLTRQSALRFLDNLILGRNNIDELLPWREVENPGPFARIMRNIRERYREFYEIREYGISYKQLEAINPTGDRMNCVSCSVSLEYTLRGHPTTAVPLLEGEFRQLASIEQEFGRTAELAGGNLDIVDQMLEAGHGARGIISGHNIRFPAESGHAWNVINHNGKVIFLDGQFGAINPIYDFDVYTLIRTD